jgi:hypothetical protein
MAGNTLQLTPITAALKVKDATMKHNSGRGANTMEFPIASIGKFVGAAGADPDRGKSGSSHGQIFRT